MATSTKCALRLLLSSSSLAVPDHLFQAVQFVRIDALVLEHVEDQEARRVVEQAGNEVAERVAARLFLIDERAIREGAAGLLVGHVPLRLEDAQHRLHRAVVTFQAAGDIGDGGGPPVPQHAHESRLSVGERR